MMPQNTTGVAASLSASNGSTPEGNGSIPEGCLEFVFSEMEFLPWDNPDNIVSAEVEEISRRIRDTILLPGLFLIGGPANAINMAVFYKQGLKDRVNLCLFALALADELFMIQAMCLYGEQLHLQFTTKERYGPMMTFMANHNLIGFYGFSWVSQIMSAIIATERCLCIISPLKFQALLRTRTMAIVIIVVYLVVVGFYLIVATKYRVGCVYDPTSGISFNTAVTGEFYAKHADFVDYLDGFVYGAGLPGATIVVVVVTTSVTTVNLRRVVAWRKETSSSGGNQSATVVSARELALTRMLIGSSVLFIACVSPIALFRFALLEPEMRVGGRYHNFYLTSLWVLEVVAYVNSSFNIFVYYAMGSHYRETFKALIRRRKSGKQEDRSIATTSTTVHKN